VNADQFGEIIVRQNPDGSTVRLKDVARIELGSLIYQQIGRFNGKAAVIIAVYQAPGSNALAVAKQLRREMEELKSRFPPGLDYAISLDTTLPVTEGMKEIVKRCSKRLFWSLSLSSSFSRAGAPPLFL